MTTLVTTYARFATATQREMTVVRDSQTPEAIPVVDLVARAVCIEASIAAIYQEEIVAKHGQVCCWSCRAPLLGAGLPSAERGHFVYLAAPAAALVDSLHIMAVFTCGQEQSPCGRAAKALVEQLLGELSATIKQERPSMTKRRQCEACWRLDDGKERFQQCGQCKSVYYCGKECQRKDWTRHKARCTIK